MAYSIYSKAGTDEAISSALADSLPTTPADIGAATAAQGALADATTVEQVALTANLAYVLPADVPANTVHHVTFTQTTGGHAVTYGGSPVTVGTTAGASTLVELWPNGAATRTVVYPGAAGASSAITVDDTPAVPAEGESASYFVTSAVVWPAGLVWSTDPDGGVAPTITGTALVSLFTLGGVTRAILGATFPADVTLPTTGMLAHFDARDLSALGEGATVATWENRIATEADLVAAGSGATYHASGGVSFVTTDGTAAGVLEAAIACAQPTTTVAVVRVSVFDTGSYPPIIGSGTAIHALTNNWGFWHISCGALTSTDVRGGTSWVTLGMAANGASTRWLVDGATGTVNAGTNGRATLRIASNTNRSEYRVMDVAWVGVWDSALSATDLTAVRDYLVAEGIAP